jgi:hypothetical protein
MQATNQANNASITAVLGASGSGKGLWVKNHLLKPRPAKLLIWDLMREDGYAKICTTATTENMKDVVNACKKPRFAVAYRPDMRGNLDKQFAMFCRIANTVPNVTVVVEELSYVTKAMYSPPDWRAMSVTGRHRGMRIIGVSQRPTSVDKDFLSQCTTIHAGRLNTARDRKTLADMLCIPIQQVIDLEPLDWIERDMATGKTTTGRVKIPASR